MVGKLAVAIATLTTTLAFAAQAHAGTIDVGKGKSCPGADYGKISQAIKHSQPGDTIQICAGTFAEGSGAQGTNALTIDHNLTLKGAGVGQTIIKPADDGGGRLA